MRRLFATVAAFLVCAAAHANGVSRTFSVADYGAKPSSTVLQTSAIQRAIDAASKSALSGSGPASSIVTFPAGTYLTGSLFVKGNVDLEIPKGVTLTGSQDIRDYPELPTRVAGIEMVWPAALINIYKQQNAAITGDGTIDGNGKIFWDSYWALRKVEEPKGLRWASDYDAKRPRLIQVFDSSNVHIGDGLLLKRPGFWTVHICYSHDVTVDGITIRANMPVDGVRVLTEKDGHGPSTDGVDIDSSRRIVVAHADIENNDDALCLKAGRDADGLRVNRPTEDVVIRDSTIRAGAAGVTFGSETSGGFRSIEVYNLHTLAAVPSGILFKSAHTRGGFGENIRIHDLVLDGTPAVLRMTMNWNPSYSYAKIPEGMTEMPPYYAVLATPVPEDKGIAHFHDVQIWDIKATGAKIAFDVDGYPAAPLERFTLDHLDIQTQTAGHIEYAKDWTFKDVVLKVADGTSVALSHDVDMTGLPAGGKPSDPNLKAPHGYEK